MATINTSIVMNENRLAGILLIVGALITIITILFEYNIGWIGADRTRSETPQFLLENWNRMKFIWSWQTFGYFISTLAYFVFFKNSQGILSPFWSILILCECLKVVAMCLTLGSYQPALEVFSSNPEVFNTIGGGIRTLYATAQLGGLFLMVVFIIETFKKNGVVHKWMGITILAFVLIAIGISIATTIPVKVTGTSSFLIPIVLGLGYLKNKN